MAAPPLAWLIGALANLAAEDRVQLAVARDDAAQVCPTDDELAERVRARIGSEPFTDELIARAVRVTLSAGARRGPDQELRARVELVGADGTPTGARELSGPLDCVALADDLVLAVAIAIDPMLLLRPAPAPPAGETTPPGPTVIGEAAVDPPPAAAPRAAEAPPAAPVTQVPRRARPDKAGALGFAARALILGSGGVASPIAPALRAGVGLEGEVMWLELDLRATAPSRLVLGDSAAPVDVGLLTAQLVPGVQLAGDVAALRGGLVAEGGAMFAQGVGLSEARRTALPWFALGARGGMQVWLAEHLSLVVELEGLVPVLRPRFVDGATGEVFAQAEPVSWNGGVGVAVTWP